MCKKTNYKSSNVRIDKCMVSLINLLKFHKVKTLACCCGHKKYDMSIVILCRDKKTIVELMSNQIIKRKKRFYKKDKQGYYYIPETIK